MSDTDVVKSTYVCDPETGLLVKREDADHNREYWDRVNQGNVVGSMTQMFEVGRREEGAAPDEGVYRDQIKVGKLTGDITRDLFGEGERGTGGGGEKRNVKVGKINTKNLFEKNEENNEEVEQRPKIKIGKLDTRGLFDSVNENKENEKEEIVVGKLNTKNLFENNRNNETVVAKRKIKVGKINTTALFAANDNDREDVKEELKVGKLNAEKLFEEAMLLIDQEEEKAAVKVGKLNVQVGSLQMANPLARGPGW